MRWDRTNKSTVILLSYNKYWLLFDNSSSQSFLSAPPMLANCKFLAAHETYHFLEVAKISPNVSSQSTSKTHMCTRALPQVNQDSEYESLRPSCGWELLFCVTLTFIIPDRKVCLCVLSENRVTLKRTHEFYCPMAVMSSMTS